MSNQVSDAGLGESLDLHNRTDNIQRHLHCMLHL
jgi:hypothetical protein